MVDRNLKFKSEKGHGLRPNCRQEMEKSEERVRKMSETKSYHERKEIAQIKSYCFQHSCIRIKRGEI